MRQCWLVPRNGGEPSKFDFPDKKEAHFILAITGNCPRFRETTERMAYKEGRGYNYQNDKSFHNIHQSKQSVEISGNKTINTLARNNYLLFSILSECRTAQCLWRFFSTFLPQTVCCVCFCIQERYINGATHLGCDSAWLCFISQPAAWSFHAWFYDGHFCIGYWLTIKTVAKRLVQEEKKRCYNNLSAPIPPANAAQNSISTFYPFYLSKVTKK